MLPSRVWQGGTREEYETQLFGFGSQQLSIALRDAVERNIVDNVREMESSLNAVGLDDQDRSELSLACDKLISLYFRGAKPALSRITSELDKLLEIPDAVVLPEDEERASTVSDQELEQLRADVVAVEKRVQRAALMEALLKVEEEELKSVEKHCELAQLMIDSLNSCSKKLQIQSGAVSKLAKETEDDLPVVKNSTVCLYKECDIMPNV